MSLVPANWTAATDGLLNNSQIVIYFGSQEVASAVPLLSGGNASQVPSDGWQGAAFLAYPFDYERISAQDIVFISCDNAPGEISSQEIYDFASQQDPIAIIMYSTVSDYCKWTTPQSENQQALFSLVAPGAYSNISSYITNAENAGDSTATTITTRDKGPPKDPNAGDPSQNRQTKDTAVAMIVLYAITGVIALLFLGIITTGAVRAHRHPERYGPGVMIGRVRRSRARGLAQAMLDTLPIVKFGERENEQAKTEDIELSGESRHGSLAKAAETRVREEAPSAATIDEVRPASVGPEDSSARPTAQHDEQAEMGIAAATTETFTVAPNASNPNHEECAICAEDFEKGQDQRVLPCNHRFHPACIDPWLLNVSGTCPMCRINLNQHAEGEDEEDENQREGTGDSIIGHDGTAIAEYHPMMNYRHALVTSILGRSSRPYLYSREERIAALRELDRHASAIRRQQREATAASATTTATSSSPPAAGAGAGAEASATDQQASRGRLRSFLARRGQRNSVVSSEGETPQASNQAQNEPLAETLAERSTASPNVSSENPEHPSS